jgi:molybdate transport system substrate-binding protein
MLHVGALALCAALAIDPAGGRLDAQAPPLTVSAAVSLTNVLEEAARAYQEAGGGIVRFNFGSSNSLARQIAAGAPVDLFISADDAQMDVAANAGVLAPGTRVNLVGNRLAFLTRSGLERPVTVAEDLRGAGVARIALGDPEAVPAGVYAKRYLETLGLWTGLRAKVVPVASVRAAVAAVENGSADAAIVYESDTVVATRATVTVITDPRQPRIVYPAAIVAAAKARREAERFLDFLRGVEAAALFTRYRFVPLRPGR